jgi:ATP-dependent helicase/DNAse subunit B
MRLSHSGLNCFNECNYRYFLEYIAHREQDYDVEEKDYFVYGSDLHNLLSKHIKKAILAVVASFRRSNLRK